MSGDDLAIFLFWVALAVPFGIEAVKADTIHSRAGFGAFAGALLLIGLLWFQIKKLWPALSQWVAELATSPQSWFTLLIFIAALLMLGRHSVRPKKPTTIGDAITRLGYPKVSEWMIPKAAMERFASAELQATVRRAEDICEEAFRKKQAKAAGLPGDLDTVIRNAVMGTPENEAPLINLARAFNDSQVDLVIARRALVDDFLRLLRDGTLVGRAVLSEPDKLHDEWTYLKPAHWVALEFDINDPNMEIVRAGKQTYKGLRVGKHEGP